MVICDRLGIPAGEDVFRDKAVHRLRFCGTANGMDQRDAIILEVAVNLIKKPLKHGWPHMLKHPHGGDAVKLAGFKAIIFQRKIHL